MNIKNYLYSCVVMLSGLCTVSCSERFDTLSQEVERDVIRGRIAHFMVDGQDSSVDGENAITEMKACVFADGKLSKIYDNVQCTDETFKLKVNETSGTLYMVANAVEAGAWHDMNVGILTEEEWKQRIVSMKDNRAVSYFTGCISLDEYSNGDIAPMVLTRGVARFDLNMEADEGVKLHAIRLEKVAKQAYFLPQPVLSSPVTEYMTMEKDFADPVVADKQGVLYVYEQETEAMKVVLDVTVDDSPKTLTANMPSSGIKRNAVYTLNLRRNAVNVKVDEWNYEDDINLSPGYTDRIVIDTEKSELAGAEVVSDGTALNVSYLPSEIELYVESKNELEAMFDGDEVVTVAPLKKENGEIERNAFKVTKRLSPIGYSAKPSVIRFRRKGMTEFYDEDRIVLNLGDNPTKLSGDLKFNVDGVCDFEKYVENTLGFFELEEGKELVVDLGEEDPWLKVEVDEENANIYYLIAGWRPNDPKGDGREQAATIIVRDKQQGKKSVSGEEQYIVKRRNWSIPVVQVKGIWWSKYNLRGDARKYEDQILTTTDPATRAGKSLFEYLNTCSSEEYFQVIGSGYQSGSSQGLTLTYSDGKWHFPNFSEQNPSVMSKVENTSMAPDGFELPGKEDFRTLVWDYSCNLGNKATDGFGNNPRGNLMYASRADLTQNGGMMEVHHHAIYYTQSSTNSTRVSDEFVLYGPGYQPTKDGAVVELYVFYATCVDENGLWTLRCDNGNTFKFESYSSNSEDKTHTVRCIKSSVQYQY